ncbi:MAG: hypothetical protein WC222_06195 [Parachlamydiales bacterium]
MKAMRLLFICMFMVIAGKTCAAQLGDSEFNQERMILSPTAIYVITSFTDEDHITGYTYKGNLLWDAPFHAKILSCKLSGDQILVFSKARTGNKTFLTCIDKYSGSLLWQRP